MDLPANAPPDLPDPDPAAASLPSTTGSAEAYTDDRILALMAYLHELIPADPDPLSD